MSLPTRIPVRRIARPLALCGSLAVWLVAARAAHGAPAATPSPPAGGRPAAATAAPGHARIEPLSISKSATEVQGKILRSTRGQRGPVRLQVARTSGGQVAVLLAPDELCDRLGLSLREGEQVTVRGALFPGRNPILVASEVVVDGKEIPVRNRGPVSAGAAGGDKSKQPLASPVAAAH